MATNVATLTAKLKADTTDLRRGLGKAEKDVRGFEQTTTQATKKGAKGFGGMKTAALGFGAALGAGAVVSFAKGAIDEFSRLEESVNAVEVVFGEASEGIADLGENSAEQFGLATAEVNEAAVAMGAFVTKIDEANPDDAFGNVLQRATDFASVMNIEVSDALANFQSGLAGESEPLRKFGIDVSAAKIESVALAEGIIGVGEKMDEGEKVQARYLTIMQQTEKTAGDFAATSDGLANKQRVLTAKWKEAQVELGGKLAPAFQKLLELGVQLIPVLGPIGDVIGILVEQVVAGFEAIEQLVKVADALGISFGETEEGTRTVGGELGEFAFSTLFAKSAYEKFREELLRVPWKPVGDKAVEFTGTLEQMALKEERATKEAEALAKTLPIVKEEIEKQTKSVGFVIEGIKNWIKTTADIRREQLKLADPVFRAISAIEDYEEALEAANEEGGISREELLELAPLFGEMELAASSLTGEHLLAWQELVGETGEAVGALPGIVGDAFAEAAALVPSREELFAGVENIFDRKLLVEFRGTLPSAADFDDALADAVARAKRGGAFAEAGGF